MWTYQIFPAKVHKAYSPVNFSYLNFSWKCSRKIELIRLYLHNFCKPCELTQFFLKIFTSPCELIIFFLKIFTYHIFLENFYKAIYIALWTYHIFLENVHNVFIICNCIFAGFFMFECIFYIVNLNTIHPFDCYVWFLINH